MKISDIPKQVASAVSAALDEVQNSQSGHRNRWLIYDEESDVYTLTRVDVEYMGHRKEMSLLAFEYPHGVCIDTVETEIETEFEVEGTNGSETSESISITNSTDPAKISIKVKMKDAQPAEGLLVLHKLVSKEVKEFAKYFHADIFDPPVNMNGETTEGEQDG